MIEFEGEGVRAMNEELVRLRADLADTQARAACATIVAELAFTFATLVLPAGDRQDCLRTHLRRLSASVATAHHPDASPARVAGLFAAFAAKHGA